MAEETTDEAQTPTADAGGTEGQEAQLPEAEPRTVPAAGGGGTPDGGAPARVGPEGGPLLAAHPLGDPDVVIGAGGRVGSLAATRG